MLFASASVDLTVLERDGEWKGSWVAEKYIEEYIKSKQKFNNYYLTKKLLNNKKSYVDLVNIIIE